MADWTLLTDVSRSPATAVIDTFMIEVSTTRTNIAIASRSGSRLLVAPPSGAFDGLLAHARSSLSTAWDLAPDLSVRAHPSRTHDLRVVSRCLLISIACRRSLGKTEQALRVSGKGQARGLRPERAAEGGGVSRRMRRWVLILCVALVVIGVVAAVVVLMGGVPVPDVTGKTQAEATKALEDAGLEVGEVTQASDAAGGGRDGPSAGPGRRDRGGRGQRRRADALVRARDRRGARRGRHGPGPRPRRPSPPPASPRRARSSTT